MVFTKKQRRFLDGFVMSIMDKLIEGQYIRYEAILNALMSENAKKKVIKSDGFEISITLQNCLKRLAKKRYIWGTKYYYKQEWYAKRFSNQLKTPPIERITKEHPEKIFTQKDLHKILFRKKR